MSLKEFVQKLEVLAVAPSYYSNKYPNNLGYVHSDGRRSFDCWNLIKAILNGYDVTNNTVGYYQKDLSKTGDTDINGLINQCTVISTDFTKIAPGAILKYTGGTHAGVYVGDHVIDGKTYNVIECTSAWEKKVLYSWLDPDGTRRHYKGCTAKNGKWVEFGYHRLVLEITDKVQADTGEKQADAVKTYKVVRGDTLWGIAKMFLGSGIKWRHIYDYNDLKTTMIKPGQILKIPEV